MPADDRLRECEQEPIHVPGSIQPHGLLLALRGADLEVVFESSNAARMLGVRGDGRLHGRRLQEFLPSLAAALAAAAGGDPVEGSPYHFELPGGAPAHGIVHRSGDLLVLEVEPAVEDEQTLFQGYRQLVRRLVQLRKASSPEQIFELAAHEVRELTGVDRVMVYRFAPDGSGEVVAEDLRDGLESFLGLHYPASDIPPQARRLYQQNLIRLIPDATFEPQPLIPSEDPLTGQPLDLSQAVLRSVSPIHCEYLRNMGVTSSMSISLLVDDRLWGLIACHGLTARVVPYGTRILSEFLGHVIAARIGEMQRVSALTAKEDAYRIQTRLIEQMVNAPSVQAGLIEGRRKLSDLIPCGGAAILYQDEVTTVGEAPSPAFIRALGAQLRDDQAGTVFISDRLSERFPAEADEPHAAGVVAVPISAGGADMLFWFRSEHVHEVQWAGDPSKPVNAETGRLSPRTSFEAWVETVRGRSRPWEPWEVEVAADFQTALVAGIIHQAAELERLNQRLVETGQQKDRFLATISHELRNPLNAIMGWVRLAKSGLPGAQLGQALGTIERNAMAQAELIDDLLDVSRIAGGRIELESVVLDLTEVVLSAMETVEPSARAKQVELHLERATHTSYVVGDPRRLQQVVWNLLSNAIKFSPARSRVEIGLSRRDSGVVMSVSDEGIGIDADFLPYVFEPFRQARHEQRKAGLGLGLSIVKSIVELHGGEIRVESAGAGKGARFELELPVSALRTPTDETERQQGADLLDERLEGLHILLVEDQRDSAAMLERILQQAGAAVEVASDGLAALEKLKRASFDLLLSDLDMPRMDGFELVARLREDPSTKRLPAVALTVYVRGTDRARALEAGFDQHVSKPVHLEELAAVIGRLRVTTGRD